VSQHSILALPHPTLSLSLSLSLEKRLSCVLCLFVTLVILSIMLSLRCVPVWVDCLIFFASDFGVSDVDFVFCWHLQSVICCGLWFLKYCSRLTTHSTKKSLTRYVLLPGSFWEFTWFSGAFLFSHTICYTRYVQHVLRESELRSISLTPIYSRHKNLDRRSSQIKHSHSLLRYRIKITTTKRVKSITIHIFIHHITESTSTSTTPHHTTPHHTK